MPRAVPSKYRAVSEHYIIGKPIGEGTFGKVRKGTHRLSGVPVAIKILVKKKIIDVADVERVAREISILKKVRHANVIRLYEVINTPKYIFLIMELASGGELFDYIVARTRVGEEESCRFFHMIVNGTEFCHHNNIIHRDLKPENLLLDRHNEIKIVDFGLGNIVEDNRLLKTACGSPCYAAPEMIAGQAYVGERVDLWSMGVILYALLCGYLPFEDSNTSVLYRKIMRGTFQCPPWVSSSAQNLLSKILNTDPKARYTIPQIRKHAWYKKVSVLTDPLPGSNLKTSRSSETDPLCESVLRQLEIIGCDMSECLQSIRERRHDHLFATYHLLQVRKAQNIPNGTIDKLLHDAITKQQSVMPLMVGDDDVDTADRENVHPLNGRVNKKKTPAVWKSKNRTTGKAQVSPLSPTEISATLTGSPPSKSSGAQTARLHQELLVAGSFSPMQQRPKSARAERRPRSNAAQVAGRVEEKPARYPANIVYSSRPKQTVTGPKAVADPLKKPKIPLLDLSAVIRANEAEQNPKHARSGASKQYVNWKRNARVQLSSRVRYRPVSRPGAKKRTSNPPPATSRTHRPKQSGKQDYMHEIKRRVASARGNYIRNSARRGSATTRQRPYSGKIRPPSAKKPRRKSGSQSSKNNIQWLNKMFGASNKRKPSSSKGNQTARRYSYWRVKHCSASGSQSARGASRAIPPPKSSVAPKRKRPLRVKKQGGGKSSGRFVPRPPSRPRPAGPKRPRRPPSARAQPQNKTGRFRKRRYKARAVND